MKYLIDSFSCADVKRVMAYYPTEGVTTNPAIVCREKTEYRARLIEIALTGLDDRRAAIEETLSQWRLEA